VTDVVCCCVLGEPSKELLMLWMLLMRNESRRNLPTASSQLSADDIMTWLLVCTTLSVLSYLSAGPLVCNCMPFRSFRVRLLLGGLRSESGLGSGLGLVLGLAVPNEPTDK